MWTPEQAFSAIAKISVPSLVSIVHAASAAHAAAHAAYYAAGAAIRAVCAAGKEMRNKQREKILSLIAPLFEGV